VVPEYTVKALDESTWPAFAALVERNNGVFGGCWCMGFHEDNKGTVPPKRFARPEVDRQLQQTRRQLRQQRTAKTAAVQAQRRQPQPQLTVERHDRATGEHATHRKMSRHAHP
jgi:hypothetical protein